MPLIKCPKCNGEAPTDAATCPHCGHQLHFGINLKNPAYFIGLLIAGLMLLVILGVLLKAC